MKVGIITLNGYNNYGNRLQNYAMQETLRNLGLEVETIWLDNVSNNLAKRLARKTADFVEKRITNKLVANREQVFIDFSRKYINETLEHYTIWDDLTHLKDKYDKVVIGSDQVWNPYYNRMSKSYFAYFADGKDVISYAASFGVSDLLPSQVEFYQYYLSRIRNISVREDAGAKIVQKILNREVPVVVDPTLLLLKSDWDKINTIDSVIEGKYILTYFLGDLPSETKNNLDNIANDYNLKIINLLDPNDSKVYLSGPSEFINLINNAELFLTDSFHGVVFSIIYQTPFVTFERDGKKEIFSRIETILKKFNLEERQASNAEVWNDVFSVDFTHSNKIISNEREFSLDYLRKSLFNE